MKFNLRNCIRLFFLLLIFVLWFNGRIHIWGPLLGIGLIFIPFLGRVYCGWVCPVSTAITLSKPTLPRPVWGEYNKLLFNTNVRLLALIISVVLIVVFNKTNFIIPFFILLIPVGVIVTLLFGEAAWHRICFIGTIYSFFGKLSMKGYYFKGENCIQCKVCAKHCPNECIEMEPAPRIINKECLICGKCKEVCKKSAIAYGALKGRNEGSVSAKGEKSEGAYDNGKI